jgi:hypothetical protein
VTSFLSVFMMTRPSGAYLISLLKIIKGFFEHKLASNIYCYECYYKKKKTCSLSCIRLAAMLMRTSCPGKEEAVVLSCTSMSVPLVYLLVATSMKL